MFQDRPVRQQIGADKIVDQIQRQIGQDDVFGDYRTPHIGWVCDDEVTVFVATFGPLSQTFLSLEVMGE